MYLVVLTKPITMSAWDNTLMLKVWFWVQDMIALV